MANTSIRLTNQFAAFSGAGKVQSAKDVPLSNGDIDTRDKCTIDVQDVVNRVTDFDCENKFVDGIRTKTGLKRVTFTYAKVRPQIMARHAGYFFGATAAPTGNAVNEVQTLTISNDAAGNFALRLSLEGKTGQTQAIPVAALTAAALQTALTRRAATIWELIKPGDITVTAGGTGVFIITYGGRLKNADLPLLQIISTGLTNGTVTIAQTTAGNSKYAPFTRATSDVKPLTSFAIGDIASGIATEKYFNAACESFETTLNEGGDVSLKVSYLCNYDPEIVIGFSVPPCINYDALPVSDCRVQINGAWETPDVFSETTTLNDNIPVDADTFGFDSFNPTVLERGDQPTYAKTGQIFGVPSDPLGIIVANESKAEYITHFGMPGDRFSLIIPALQMLPQSNPRQFAGARNRRVIAFDGTPTRDNANAPVKAEFRGSQSVSFLTF